MVVVVVVVVVGEASLTTNCSSEKHTPALTPHSPVDQAARCGAAVLIRCDSWLLPHPLYFLSLFSLLSSLLSPLSLFSPFVLSSL